MTGDHGPLTPRPGRRDEWRCAAHEPLIERVAAIDERTQRILAILEQQQTRDDRLDDAQRQAASSGQRLAGAWGGALRVLGLIVALGATIGVTITAIAAVVKIIGG